MQPRSENIEHFTHYPLPVVIKKDSNLQIKLHYFLKICSKNGWLNVFVVVPVPGTVRFRIPVPVFILVS